MSTTRDVPALRVLRTERKMAQADLAVACGVSQATISDLENGRRPLTNDRAVELAKALGCAPDELLQATYKLVRRKTAKAVPVAGARR